MFWVKRSNERRRKNGSGFHCWNKDWSLNIYDEVGNGTKKQGGIEIYL